VGGRRGGMRRWEEEVGGRRGGRRRRKRWGRRRWEKEEVEEEDEVGKEEVHVGGEAREKVGEEEGGRGLGGWSERRDESVMYMYHLLLPLYTLSFMSSWPLPRSATSSCKWVRESTNGRPTAES